MAEGFSGQDFVNAGPETYLDFPGNPRKPECRIRRLFPSKS